MVLAEYNGGPLNAGYFRAGVGQLAAETRSYVPRVLELHQRLKEEFEKGLEHQLEGQRDAGREGKTLDAGRAQAGSSAGGAGQGRPSKGSSSGAPSPRSREDPTAR